MTANEQLEKLGREIDVLTAAIDETRGTIMDLRVEMRQAIQVGALERADQRLGALEWLVPAWKDAIRRREESAGRALELTRYWRPPIPDTPGIVRISAYLRARPMG
jgi:hypothetical protein